MNRIHLHATLLLALGIAGGTSAITAGCGGGDEAKTGDESNITEGLDDPFARLVIGGGCTVIDGESGKSFKTTGEGGDCPTQVTAVLDKLAGTAKKDPNVFVVSERGDQPGPDTGYRFVVAQGSEDSTPDQLLMSMLGGASGVSQGFLEVMAFSKSKQAYNYYELKKGKWQFAGDGTMVRPGESAAFACANCHTSGGPLMKELQDSWNNWSSIWFSMPDPKSTDATFQRLFSKKQGAENLEDILFVGMKAHAEGRIERELRGNNLKGLLRQVMCEVAEPNFVSSHNRNNKRFPKVEVSSFMNFPPSILVSQALRPGSKQDGYERLIGMDLPAMNDLQFNGASYAKAVETIGQTVGGEPGDTIFGLFFPERGFADNAVTEALIKRGILDKDLAADLLMTDFTVPAYSTVRCQLADTAPESGDKADDVRKAWIANLDGSDLAGAAELKARLEDAADFEKHQTAVNAFLTACAARNTSEADAYALDIVKLASQRRKEFVEQYESLVESADLVPADTLTDTAPHTWRLNATTCALEEQSTGAGSSSSGGSGDSSSTGGQSASSTGGGGSTCAHPECTAGEKLDAACSECAGKVCGADSFCCESEWDSKCVEQAQTLCSCT